MSDRVMKNDRPHQLRMLRACWELNQIRETLVESTKLFPEVALGTACVDPSTAVAAYSGLILSQTNLLLSLIEGIEGIDYPAETAERSEA